MATFDPQSTKQRFDSKYPRPLEGCWEWEASTTSGGYGQFAIGGKPYAAHRLSWQYAFGPIPDGLIVLHRCDNRLCVRPDHLSLGTHADNSRDMHSRGRWHYVPPGQARAKPTGGKKGLPPAPLPERFWPKVDTHGGDIDVCWEWQASLWKSGYGRFFVPGRTKGTNRVYAHRVAYELHYGEIPNGMLVLHNCDNRLCCNPHHLRLGTHADNAADRDMRGRTADQSGAKNGNSKLDAEQVLQIRTLAAGGMTQMKIAARFDVKQPQVSRLVRGTSWPDGPWPEQQGEVDG